MSILKNHEPLVSVIMPVYNEEQFLPRSLGSLLANDYPAEKVELIVVDGRSTDRSRQIVQEYQRKNPHRRIQLLDNPKRIIPVGLNIGLYHAQGEIIIRADAHTVYAPDYIRSCVLALQNSGAGCVGGVQRAVGESRVERAIAAAVSSPFAAGNAYYRYANREMFVDTVYLGAWRRETLLDLGGWREDLEVNEDYELNYRLRMNGHRILLSPRIRCEYYVRPNFTRLMRQYFRYGYWKVKMLRIHPRSLQLRQVAAPLLILGLLASFMVFPWNHLAGMILPLTYLLAATIAAVTVAYRIGLGYFFLVLLAFLIIHLPWGLGFLWGVIRLSASDRQKG